MRSAASRPTRLTAARAIALRTTAALAVGALALASLTGCSFTAKQDWAKYEAAIEAVDGVDEAVGGLTHNLPFSPSGEMSVRFPAEKSTLDAVDDVACAPPSGVPTRVDYDLASGSGVTEVPAYGRPAPTDPLALAEAFGDSLAASGFPAATSDPFDFPALIVSSYTHTEYRAEVRAASAGFTAQASALAAAVEHLDGPAGELRGDSIALVGIPAGEWADYLDDAVALDAAFPLERFDIRRGSLAITTLQSDPDADAVQQVLESRSAARYADLDVTVAGAGSGSGVGSGGVSAGTSQAAIDLVATLRLAHPDVSFLAYGDAVSADVDDCAALLPIAADAAAAADGTVAVALRPRGVPSFGIREAPSLDPDTNPYPDWCAQYAEIAADSAAASIWFSADLLEVWPTADTRRGSSELRDLKALVERVARAGGYSAYAIARDRVDL